MSQEGSLSMQHFFYLTRIDYLCPLEPGPEMLRAFHQVFLLHVTLALILSHPKQKLNDFFRLF